MKKLFYWILALSLLLVFGCAQEKPEAAAKKIFEKQVAGHGGVQLDASGLDYDLVEQDGDRAWVEVTGLMPVKATIPLAKKQGKWILDTPTEAIGVEPPPEH
jgi:hypothetical protein